MDCPLCQAPLERADLVQHLAEEHLGGGITRAGKLDDYLANVLDNPGQRAAVRLQMALWLRMLAADFMPTEVERATSERQGRDPFEAALALADLADIVERDGPNASAELHD